MPRDYRLIERDWKERLDAVRTAEGQALPARAKIEIERECRRLWLAKQMLAEVEREIEQMIAHEWYRTRVGTMTGRMRRIALGGSGAQADRGALALSAERNRAAGDALVASDAAALPGDRDQPQVAADLPDGAARPYRFGPRSQDRRADDERGDDRSSASRGPRKRRHRTPEGAVLKAA